MKYINTDSLIVYLLFYVVLFEDDPVLFLYTLDNTISIAKNIRRDEWLVEIDEASIVKEGDKILINLGGYGGRFEGRIVRIESIQNIIRLAIKELT